MSAPLWIAILIGLIATTEDLLRRRISNWIPAAALGAGLVCHSATGGWRGLGISLLGAACGFLVFLVFYCLGGMGGGDVKLMAGFGALLGPGRLLDAALWTAACGGLLAVTVLLVHEIGRRWKRAGARAEAVVRVETIPYAPAISAGVLLALIPKT